MAFKVGQLVIAPVPVCVKTAPGFWEVCRPRRDEPRICQVMPTTNRRGALMLKVRASKRDEDGNPHYVFCQPGEVKPYVPLTERERYEMQPRRVEVGQ